MTDHKFAFGSGQQAVLVRGDDTPLARLVPAKEPVRDGVKFIVSGRLFQPYVELYEGSDATVTWQYLNGTVVATGPTPVMMFAGAQTRKIWMTCSRPEDIRIINLGFDHTQDIGKDVLPTAYDKDPEPVFGVDQINYATHLYAFMSANTPLTGHLDFSGMDHLVFVETMNAKVQSVDVTGCTAMIRLCLEQNDIRVIDLNPVRHNLKDFRSAANRTGHLRFVPLLGPMEELWHYCLRDQGVIDIIPWQFLPKVEQYWAWNTGQITSDQPISPAVNNIMIFQNNYTVTAVNNLMIGLDAHHTGGGYLDIQGAPLPTGAGLTAYNSLLTKGWTILYGAMPDVTPPTVPTGLAASAIGVTTLTLDWADSTDAVGVTGYEVRQNGVTIATPATSTLGVTGLSPSTSYTFDVRARDAAGNWSAYCATINPTTLPAPDTTAPTVPTGLAASLVTTTGCTLSWTASTDAVGVTGYEVRQNGSSVATPATNSQVITGLSPSTTYTFDVRARDAAGNWSAYTSTISVTTGTPPDTTAPTVPTGLAASAITDTTLTLNWTASTDAVGVTGYEVRRNGTLIASPATNAALPVTGLTASTTYSFDVRARDAAGNWSAYCTAITPTTAAPSALIADDFTTASGLWTAGGAAASYGVSSGRFDLVTPNSGYQRAQHSTTLPDDCTVIGTRTSAVVTANSQYFGVFARWDGTHGVGVLHNGGASIMVFDCAAYGANPSTPTFTATHPSSWTAMRVVLLGATVNVYLDATLVWTGPTSYSTSGGSGRRAGFVGDTAHMDLEWTEFRVTV